MSATLTEAELAEFLAVERECTRTKERHEKAKTKRAALRKRLGDKVPLNDADDRGDVHVLHGKTLRRIRVQQPERFDFSGYRASVRSLAPSLRKFLVPGSSYERWTFGDAED